MVAPTLIRPQAEFLALPHRFRAYVAGFGSGKTWVGCGGLCKTAWEYPGIPQGYFAPTYPQIRDIFYPTIEEVAHDWGLTATVKVANAEVELHEGRIYRGVILCRSMDNPNRIVGLKIARALVDEIDTMPMDKATNAWRKLIARLRYQFDGQNGADVTTTPEGFKFTYNTWVKALRDEPDLAGTYGLIQASTYENEKNLPNGYIESMRASYTGSLIDAYLNGQFVNLTQGRVYTAYDRVLNRSRETVNGDEPVYIGIDFNINKMSGVVHVRRDGNPHAVWEFVNLYDTPALIQAIKDRYWKYENGEYKRTRQIRVYPDSTGKNQTRVGFGVNDIALLEQAGFLVNAPRSNPPIKDRVTAMNAMFCNAQGERRYFVNDETCPTYTEDLEQQAYDDNGDPDKKSDKDHRPDAAGYFIHQAYPVKRPAPVIPLRSAL